MLAVETTIPENISQKVIAKGIFWFMCADDALICRDTEESPKNKIHPESFQKKYGNRKLLLSVAVTWVLMDFDVSSQTPWALNTRELQSFCWES